MVDDFFQSKISLLEIFGRRVFQILKKRLPQFLNRELFFSTSFELLVDMFEE